MHHHDGDIVLDRYRVLGFNNLFLNSELALGSMVLEIGVAADPLATDVAALNLQVINYLSGKDVFLQLFARTDQRFADRTELGFEVGGYPVLDAGHAERMSPYMLIRTRIRCASDCP